MNPLQRRGINKLPLELLVNIFDLASTYRFLDEGRTVPPSYILFDLSHVCRTWRTAVRGAPQLWTIVCGIEPPVMIREITTLSQKMPLAILSVEEESDDEGGKENSEEEHRDEDDTEEWHGIGYNDDDDKDEEWHGIEWDDDEDRTNRSPEDIHGDSDDESDNEGDDESDDGDENEGGHDSDEDDIAFGVTTKDTAEILLAQLHRISDIDILLDSNDTPGLFPLFDADAPLLEFLRLCVVGGDAPVVIHPFRGTAPPRLTKLALMGGCELSLSSSLWANLTQLYLHSDTSQREPYQTDGGFALFSRALAQMSSLTDLDMTFAIPLISATSTHSPSPPSTSRV